MIWDFWRAPLTKTIRKLAAKKPNNKCSNMPYKNKWNEKSKDAHRNCSINVKQNKLISKCSNSFWSLP